MHYLFYIALFALGKAFAYEDVPSNEEIKSWRLVFTKRGEENDPDPVVEEKGKEKDDSGGDNQDLPMKNDTSDGSKNLKGSIYHSCKNPNDVALTFDDGIRYANYRLYP